MQTLGGYLFAIWIFGYGFSLVVVLLIPGLVAGARIWQFYLIPGPLKRAAEWPPGYEMELKGELKKLKEPWPEDLYLYLSADGSTLNGGRVGMGNHSRLMISSASAQFLTPRELAILITREERYLAWSSHQKHFHYSLGWGLLGVLVTIPEISLLVLSGIASWLWMLAALTTWHGLGVVILPGIARRQILKADSEMAKAEVSKKEYASLLKKLYRQNGTPSPGLGILEPLFHSMPSLETRLNRLEHL
jgi:STE24 endopeptidase